MSKEIVFQAEGHPGQVEVAGALSSPGPEFELIPTIGLVRLAERFMLGEVRKGDKAWNAMSSNQGILLNRKFLLNRIGHIIAHCLKLRDKVMNDLPFVSDDPMEDDDAGAIAWGGIFAICATDAIERERLAKGLSDADTPTKKCRKIRSRKPRPRVS